jgi:hypothetical protein
MRKLTVGLMVLGLLMALAGPVTAQIMDPLGLIASGVVLPYLGSVGDTVAFGAPLVPGSQAWLEIYSPTGNNPNLHMFYYSQACARGPESVGLPMTINDVELFRLDFVGSKNPVNGLVTLANADSTGFQLNPLTNIAGISTAPIAARVLWVNAAGGWIRTIDPIQVAGADGLPVDGFLWNPLRTASFFFAPREIPGTESTTMYFVCPNAQISSALADSAFPHSRFPAIIPPFRAVGSATLRYRIYDTDERFLRDFADTCDCLTQRSLSSASMPFVYQDVNEAPEGTYTEVEAWKAGGFVAGNEQPFVAYRAMRFNGPPAIDVFSRMTGAHNLSISGPFVVPLAR